MSKILNRLIILLLFTQCILIILLQYTSPICIETPNLYKTSVWNDSLISHALGQINEDTYTNSKEAFLNSYNNGLRTFEVDLQLTSDQKVVLSYYWEKNFNNKIPTEEEFLNAKIKGKYTPLSFKDLLHIVNDYPDIWIITDSKYIDKENISTEFVEMKNTAIQENLLKVFDKFIIQIYNEEMLSIIKSIYPFENIIFTLYTRWNGDLQEFEEICKWKQGKRNKIYYDVEFSFQPRNLQYCKQIRYTYFSTYRK